MEMNLKLGRRTVLRGLGATALLSVWPALTAAATNAATRLVLVILRGGLDGIAAVPPHGEPRYAAARGALAIPVGGSDGAHRLDGLFALHPALAHCARLWQENELAVVHAIAPPYHGRSHFEAQDCLENGSAAPHGARDGWLGRALAALPGAEGLAVASAMPLALRGGGRATTWSPSPLAAVNEDLAALVARLYARDPLLAEPFARALEANGIDAGARRGGFRTRLPEAMRAAARFLSGDAGLRVALVQDGGWDTHARQGAGQGLLANKLRELDTALEALQRGLGATWKHTLVVVATEFGRTVSVNGSGGTDHGTGGALLLAGGAVRGGKVYGDWPGLAPAALRDGRDLRPTTDTRALFKTVLREHLRVPESALETNVFPGSGALAPMTALVRA